jgi:hypothetical protein
MKAHQLLPLLIVVMALGPRAGFGQDDRPALTATPSWSPDRHVASSATLSLALNRTPDAGARVAWLIGALDVSALARTTGAVVSLTPRSLALPSGDHEVTVYEVSSDTLWREMGRFPLRVLTPGGFVRRSATPNVDLSTAGQVAQRLPSGSPPPDRSRYQDATLTAGFEGRLERPGSQLSAVARTIAVSEPQQRLRWATRQSRAPSVDLAEYRLEYVRGAAQVRMGHVNVGTSRHLVNGFGSRGLATQISLGRSLLVSAGLNDGSSQVGWDHLLGVSRADHRLATAGIDWQLLPGRPGALALSLQALDASILPIGGFTQGTVNDAEESGGHAISVVMSDPAQRLRLSAGYTSSRFTNPNDPLLSQDSAIVSVRNERRAARYLEGGVQLLSNARLTPRIPVSASFNARFERVDPLYRSIGAPVQADVDQRGGDFTASVGAIQLQASRSASRDNLGRVASILTTRTDNSGFSIVLPVGAAAGLTTQLLPTLTAAWQRTHQRGEGVPLNSGFNASSVPDQISRAPSLSASWQFPRWGFSWRWNRSHQDNRQPGRERADFTARVHAVVVNLTPGEKVSVGLDASDALQRSEETGTNARTLQISSTAQYRPFGQTSIQLSWAPSWMRDELASQRRAATTGSVELSQGIALFRRVDGGSQGRAFLRYSWSGNRAGALSVAGYPDVSDQWSLSSGLSLRLY